ncbi:MAG: tripartite tricarboxylate transporter substrate binding protein, partial [Betaproteobacteria bacterium]|nr:tripartite tricarboxylate transporter substrate binding protein [Betaproteobacteria bacterium]
HTNLNLPAKSARELTDLVKANPGKFSYGSSGNGAVNHMAGELWKSKAGLDITHVPYKGGMPAATDMIGGSIDMMFSAVLEAKPMIDSGKTKGMAVSSAKRIDIMPQLPTLAEALGIPSLVAEFWMGLYVPPGTPQSIIDKLAVTVQKIASDAAFRERFAKQGVTVRSSSTQELKEFMEQEARQWTEIIRANNIKS